MFTGVYTLSTKTISTYTNLFSKAGSYEMQVKVSYTELPAVYKTQNFTILVTNACLTDTLTIDAMQFLTPAASYYIRHAAVTLSWSDTFVTSAVNLPSVCGSYSWTVTKTDGVTAIDSTIFSLNLTTKTIST